MGRAVLGTISETQLNIHRLGADHPDQELKSSGLTFPDKNHIKALQLEDESSDVNDKINRLKTRLQLAVFKIQTNQLSLNVDDLINSSQAGFKRDDSLKDEMSNPSKRRKLADIAGTKRSSLKSALPRIQSQNSANVTLPPISKITAHLPPPTFDQIKRNPNCKISIHNDLDMHNDSLERANSSTPISKKSQLPTCNSNSNSTIICNDTTIQLPESSSFNRYCTPVKLKRENKLFSSPTTRDIFTPSSMGAAKSLLQLSSHQN
ncbi:hypothetical protein LJB42_004632 [Komagataella kurtzmanii]|nr:hypothetical protein LJB42_004632 [Komagataella kurtzmanii]